MNSSSASGGRSSGRGKKGRVRQAPSHGARRQSSSAADMRGNPIRLPAKATTPSGPEPDARSLRRRRAPSLSIRVAQLEARVMRLEECVRTGWGDFPTVVIPPTIFSDRPQDAQYRENWQPSPTSPNTILGDDGRGWTLRTGGGCACSEA